MKKYFAVSFKYSETVYCSNIAHAETVEAVEAHYSKYERVSVRECEGYEVEEARRRGKPIIEVETPIKEQEEQNEEENTMTEYKNIKNEVITDSESRKNNIAFYILNGYMPTWAAEHHGDLDRGLQEYSTATRWEQYKNGRITREKAVEFATARAFREIDKKTAAQLAQLDRVAAAPALSYLSILVDWVRSRTWGYNPHAEAMSNAGTFTGTASGCGYDKESAAVAEALNQCDSVLQLLYTYKENALAAGESDESKTASCGRSNGSIIGYGAGYGAIPYFEGGAGVSCFWSILKKCGFEVRGHHGTHSDFYTIEKGVA